jgi:hypothetical protein
MDIEFKRQIRYIKKRPIEEDVLGRETGFEPATFASTGRRSAVELLPPYFTDARLYH